MNHYDYGNKVCNMFNYAVSNMCYMEDCFEKGKITEEILLNERLRVLMIVKNSLDSDIEILEKYLKK